MLNIIIDFLFPRSSLVRKIEEMTDSQFSSRSKRSRPLENGLDKWADAPFSYKDPLVKAAVWEIKYRGNRRIASLLARVLLEEVMEALGDAAAFDGLSDVTLVPIPLSKKRMRERGFNQAELLAEAFCSSDSEGLFFYEKSALCRVKETRSQTSIRDRSERIRNVRGCFSVKNRERVFGKDILLLDDVITTGATMAEARRTLLASGARSVRGLAAAH